MMTIAGRECNLLLFALDDLATDRDGKIRRTADEFTMKQAQDCVTDYLPLTNIRKVWTPNERPSVHRVPATIPLRTTRFPRRSHQMSIAPHSARSVAPL
jgi:hypothetical protein